MNTINLAFKKNFSSGHNLKMVLKNVAAGLGASAILIIALFMLFGGFSGYPGLLASLSGDGDNNGFISGGINPIDPDKVNITIIKKISPAKSNEFFTFKLSDDNTPAHTESIEIEGNAGAGGVGSFTPFGVVGTRKVTINERLTDTGRDILFEYRASYSCVTKINGVWFELVRSGSGFEVSFDVKNGDEIVCTFINTHYATSGQAKLTIIKEVVSQPGQYTHTDDPIEHKKLEFDFEVYKLLSKGNLGTKEFNTTLDGDGTEFNSGGFTEPKSLDVYTGFTAGLHVIKEIPNVDSYNTKWECYYDSNPNDRSIHGFGKETYGILGIGVELKENDPMTCIFTNTLADAELTIIKDIIPDSDDFVDFDIYTPNDNEHANGYDYFSLQDRDTHPNNSTHTTKMVSKDEQGNHIVYTIGELLGLRGNGNPEFDNIYDVSYECVDENGNVTQTSITNPENDKGTFELNPFNAGDKITCTFTNQKNGEVIVRKLVDPAPQNNTEGFDFKIEQQRGGLFTKPALFNLSHGESSSSFYPRFGWQQNITEVLTSEQNTKYWTSYSCKLFGPDGKYKGEVSSPAGEHTVDYNPTPSDGTKADCTFTNHLLEITIAKKVIDKDGNEINTDRNVFNFKTNLEPNNFTLLADRNLNDPKDTKNSAKKFYFNTKDGVKVEEVLDNSQSYLYSTRYECIGRTFSKSDNGTKIDLSGLKQNDNDIICTFINTELPEAIVSVHMQFINNIGVPEEDPNPNAYSLTDVYPSKKPLPGDEKKIGHDKNATWDNVTPGDTTVNQKFIYEAQRSYIPSFSKCVFYAPPGKPARPDISSTSGIIEILGLESGYRVQCTLLNKVVETSLRIKKDVVGSNGKDLTDDPGVFKFENKNTGETFDLDDNIGQTNSSEKSFELDPNTDYAFSEIGVPSGYTVSYECVDDNTKTVLITGSGADITGLRLKINQTATCTFTNTKAVATIFISKLVNGSTNNTEEFEIKSNAIAPNFNLKDNPNRDPKLMKEILVPAGASYTFTEILNANQLADYKVSYWCTGNNTTIYDITASGTNKNEFTFNSPTIGTNESITCTFINTKLATQIIIKKDVVNEDGTDITDDKEVFQIINTTEIPNSDFYLDDNSDPTYPNQMILDVDPTKIYSFVEKLTLGQNNLYTRSWSCNVTGPIYTGPLVENIKVPKGSTVICIIKNVKKSFNQKIIIKKETNPAGAPDTFAIALYKKGNIKMGGNILLKHGGSAERVVTSDAEYRLHEFISPGHPVTSYTCRYIPGNTTYHPFSGNGKFIPYSTSTTNPHPTFFLPKGHDIECTFKNCKNGLLCPLIGTPNDPDPTGGIGSANGGGGNQ